MAVNKVEANGETLIDLTNDTVQASDVLKGKTLHLASGVQVEGTYDHDNKQDTFVDLWEAEIGSAGVNELDIDELSDFIDNYSALIVMLSNENDDSETVGLACTLASAYCDLTYAFKHGNAAISAMISLQPNMEFPSVRTVFSWIYMDQSPYESTSRHIYVIATRDSSVPPSLLAGLYLRKIVGIPISGWKLAVLSGYMPLTFPSNGDDLLNYRIYGTAEGAGVQTENLCELTIANCGIDNNGTLASSTAWQMICAPIVSGKQYTIVSDNVVYGFYTSKPEIGSIAYNGTRYAPGGKRRTFIADITGWMAIRIESGRNDVVMLVEGSTPPSTYIPYGYTLPIENTSGTQSKNTVIPIGDTKLMAGDYIDYESGKIFKAKRIHEDTVTIDGIVWDILDYDHDEVYKADGTRAKHTVTIQTHDIIDNLQYSAKQAAFAFPNGLAAGTYHFTVGAHPWVAGDVNKVLTFTLANAIPAGGQLVFNGAYNKTLVGTTISAFASPTSTTAAETVTMTEGDTGTDLGTILRSKTDAINSIDRALLGSNNWLESAMRQYLNSDKAAGSVWTPQSVFDRPPAWAATTAGFLHGIDPDFVAVLGNVKKTTGLNSISDGGGTAVHDEKFFLLSRSEVYIGDEYTGGEDTPYAYYKNYSDNQRPSTSADKNRIKYRAGVAKNWWLRSPIASGASGVRLVGTSGAWNVSYATGTYGVAPACCIVLDDMDDWVKQTFYTEVDADLPAIETFSGDNTLDSTETLGEVTIKGKIKH